MIERKRPTSQVRAKREKERIYIIPYYKVAADAVNYGSKVKLLSISEQREYTTIIKDYHEYAKLDIPPVHALIINKSKGEIVTWEGFTYQILEIA